MKKMTIYATRPRQLFGNTDDVNFLNCLHNKFNAKGQVLAEGHDFKYLPSLDMYSKMEKIVSKVDKVIVLHVDGFIDQNQYYEVSIALTNNITVLAQNINSRVSKKVGGFEKFFISATNKGAILKFTDITPNL